jgi:hypothetical protein
MNFFSIPVLSAVGGQRLAYGKIVIFTKFGTIGRISVRLLAPKSEIPTCAGIFGLPSVASNQDCHRQAGTREGEQRA